MPDHGSFSYIRPYSGVFLFYFLLFVILFYGNNFPFPLWTVLSVLSRTAFIWQQQEGTRSPDPVLAWSSSALCKGFSPPGASSPRALRAAVLPFLGQSLLLPSTEQADGNPRSWLFSLTLGSWSLKWSDGL